MAALRIAMEGRYCQLDKAMLALGLAGIDPAGTTFVDIGAHVGTSTIRALRRHGLASALCFEPEPYNFRILRANLAVNNLDGVVRTFNVALSNHEGRAPLRLKKREAEATSWSRSSKAVARRCRFS